MNLCDMHIHSKFSIDGIASIEDICERAIRLNLKTIAIVDHAEAMVGKSYTQDEHKNLVEREHDILNAKDSYTKKLDVLYGVELGQTYNNPDYASKILTSFAFDFVLGSVHYYHNNVDIYDIDFTKENLKDEINRYFGELIEMAKTGEYDSFGHIDYVMRRLPMVLPKATLIDFREPVFELLKIIAGFGKAVELNTSGVRKWYRRSGIEPWMLKEFRALGGQHITIGSDAHKVEHIGYGIRKTIEYAKANGFDYYTIYKNRQPQIIRI